MVKKLARIIFFRSWWVIAFILLCGILYENGLSIREVHYRQLKEQLNRLQSDKRESIKLQKNLMLQIDSQTDFAWKELTLKRIFGLVSENEVKVFFDKGKSGSPSSIREYSTNLKPSSR